ncbi:MAG TPA: SMP-30/gluconolactonase/LRE family protein [Planctomycetaceae bacterium]|jgi:gluconolactonase|nr:SMP-30/gluconolactonase/LRE family protein [Planctomycetaceae bacterium]
MKPFIVSFLLVTALALNYVAAQAPPAQAPLKIDKTIVRLDPSLDKIVSPDAQLETIKDNEFRGGEGPVWMPQGYLLFSAMVENRIYKYDPKEGVSVFMEKSGLTYTTIEDFRAHGGAVLVGTNGLAVDKEGRLVAGTHGDRNLWRIEKDGTKTILADHFGDKKLNGPNDLAIKSDGAIYFTDRGSGLEGAINSPHPSPLREYPIGIMRWKGGKLDQLAKDDGVNGLAFSPDEKYLYAISQFAKYINRYPVNKDGTLGEPQIAFIDQSKDPARGNPDGMKVDRNGNIFTTGPGGVWIVNPAGKLLGKILLPRPCPNLSFGDTDGKGLYIVGVSLYHIRLKEVGHKRAIPPY